MAITDPTVAMAVINEAKSSGVFAGEVPDNDGAKLAQANELLKMAEQAKEAGVQAAAVMAVINAAQQQPGATAVPANPFGNAPVAAPAADPAPAPAAAPSPEPAGDVNSIIADYDDLKVADVLAAMESLTDEQIAVVKAYEASEGERAKILGFERHPATQAPAPAAPAEPAPAAQASVEVQFANVPQEQYAATEPWAGYAKAKINDIMDVVENVFRTNGEQAKPLLAHVWEYESNNKERKRLIDKLTEIAQNGVAAAPAAAPAPAPEPEGVVAEAPFQPPATPAPAPVAAPPATSTEVGFEGVAAPLAGATQKAQALVAHEGLPVPTQVGQPPVLPEDFTQLSDVEVRQYQSKFNACHARAIYLLAIAEGHSNDAKIAADAAVQNFIRTTEFPAKVTVTQMDAQASASAEVATARHTQHEWAEVARQYKALRDIYASTCERLSREQTGRADEKNTTR